MAVCDVCPLAIVGAAHGVHELLLGRRELLLGRGGAMLGGRELLLFVEGVVVVVVVVGASLIR